jgi:hypothetical protein
VFDAAYPLVRLAVLCDDFKVGYTLANCDMKLARKNDPKESFS